MSAANNVPKVQLDLDDVLDASRGEEPLSPSRSIVSTSIRDHVEDEKCVVAQYRTTLQQKQAFIRLLSGCSREEIPVEWVIDIADESNGWFYATAYHYNDVTQMLHVMVPDKVNPTFDGHVQLDHRTVHLIECVDGQSVALFNKIVRDSIIKIKWELEWYEEPEEGSAALGGGWITSFARYYIRIANQLLVEDKDVGQESRGFVIITADLSVRLLSCLKGRGEDDFSRLITEGVVNGTPDAADFANAYIIAKKTPQPSPEPGQREKKQSFREDGPKDEGGQVVKKLAEMSRGLKECVDDIVEERNRRKNEVQTLSGLFKAFALEGDLDCGMRILDQLESKGANGEEEEAEEEKMEATVEDAIYLSHKLERSLLKAMKNGAADFSQEEEYEQMKKALKKMKKDIEEKDKELKALKNKN